MSISSGCSFPGSYGGQAPGGCFCDAACVNLGDCCADSCPACGLAYSEFKARGRLGCPNCYGAFAPVLVPLLEKVHGTASHTGKAPERVATTLETRRELAELEDELGGAVASEEYERAAELRDRIRQMKGTDSES